MVCVKVVCERECVTKLCVEAAGPVGAGYRIKNNNPTQRCGEWKREFQGEPYDSS